ARHLDQVVQLVHSMRVRCNEKRGEASGSPLKPQPLRTAAGAGAPGRESSGGQLGFDLFHDAAKSRRVVDGQIGENLAVDLDLGLLQTVGELAVRQAASASTRIDTGDPQLAEHALASTAVAVGVLARLHHRLFGDAVDVAAAAAETFGQ